LRCQAGWMSDTGMSMSLSNARSLLHLVLSAVYLAFLFIPVLNILLVKVIVLLLFFAETGESTLRAWKLGQLSVPLGQLTKNPPRSEPFQVLAFVLGITAVFRILLS
jgi:hypothetical protein